MKKIISAALLITFSSQSAFALEIFEGKPGRKYEMVSPISSDKTNNEKAFADLKKKAEKMGADAIIDMHCKAGEKIRTGLLQVRMLGQSSSCEGTAVKWKK
jgi:uncharacterized protein YbjQ (UPF0145 family)